MQRPAVPLAVGLSDQPETGGGERLALVLDKLAADLDDIIADSTALARALPTYSTGKVDDLASSIRRNFEIATKAIRASSAPSLDELSAAASVVVEERMSQGVPVEDMVRALQISIGVIHHRFVELAQECRVPTANALRYTQLLWSVSDAFTTQIAVEYQKLRAASVARDESARVELIEMMLTGTVGAGDLTAACVALGLQQTSVIRAVSAVMTGTLDARLAGPELQRTGSLPATPAVVVVLDGRCAGLVATVPRPIAGAVVGLGDPVPLHEAHRSFVIARRVADAAAQLGHQGVVTKEDLSWKLAAVGEPMIATVLSDRYLAPLHAEGEFGAQIVESVWAYVESDRNTSDAAARLHVHRNTLRYRLRRFEVLTGASLDATNTLVEISWLMAATRADHTTS